MFWKCLWIKKKKIGKYHYLITNKNHMHRHMHTHKLLYHDVIVCPDCSGVLVWDFLVFFFQQKRFGV